MNKHFLIIVFFYLIAFNGFAQDKTTMFADSTEAEVADSVSTTQPIEIRKKKIGRAHVWTPVTL